MSDVTDATFKHDVVERSVNVPVVVELWAVWSKPCKNLAAILKRVVAGTGDRVELVRADVDSNPQIAAALQVKSIPAVYAFRNRRVVDSFIGAQPEEAVREFIGRLAPVEPHVDRRAVPDEGRSSASLSTVPTTPTPMFLNYRREETEGHAGRLYDLLVRQFGDNSVFMDIDMIAPGEDFVAAIERAISASSVGIVMIGRQWLTITDSRGRRRLDQPGDWVRTEIEALLRRGIPVIPVLVQGAKMPNENDLPQPIASLSRRHALEIGARFHDDVGRLIAAILRSTRHGE